MLEQVIRIARDEPEKLLFEAFGLSALIVLILGGLMLPPIA
jgi:hypothetical protein